MKSKRALLSLLGLLAMTVAAYGHHSFAATYDEAKTIEIKGKVVVFSFRNPHSFITVEVADEKGKKVRWGCGRPWIDAAGEQRHSKRHPPIWRRGCGHRKPVAESRRAEASASYHEAARWIQLWIHGRTAEGHGTIGP